MFDFHVPTQVAFEVEFAGAIRALKGLAPRMQMHVAQQVVHAVERFPTHLVEKESGQPLEGPALLLCI